MKALLVIAFYAVATPLFIWALQRWNMRTPHPRGSKTARDEPKPSPLRSSADAGASVVSRSKDAGCCG